MDPSLLQEQQPTSPYTTMNTINHSGGTCSNNENVDKEYDSIIHTQHQPIIISLAYVEVRPVLDFIGSSDNHNDGHSLPTGQRPPSLTSAFIKHHLIQDTHCSMMIMNSPLLSSSSSSLSPSASASNCIVLKNSTIHSHPISSSSSSSTRHEYSNSSKYLLSGSLIMLQQQQYQEGDDNDVDNDQHNRDQYIYFPTNEPFNTTLWPCCCYGYAVFQDPMNISMIMVQKHSQQLLQVLVTESTLVVVSSEYGTISVINSDWKNNYDYRWKDQLTGEVASYVNNNTIPNSDIRQKERYKATLQVHNPTTIVELTFRLKQQLIQQHRQSSSVYIGTTPNIYTMNQHQINGQKLREQHIRNSIKESSLNNIGKSGTIRKYPTTYNNTISNLTSNTTLLLHDVALLVHSPDYGDEKVDLVESIIAVISNDMGTTIKVHTIQPGPLFAKYGINADVAIQSIVHTILIQAAVRDEYICIIFDHFDCYISNNQNDRNNLGDAATPILQNILSYIRTLLISIRTDRVVPFPRNNPLYNYDATTSSSCTGVLVPINVCLVAVMTCPDHASNVNSEIMNMPGMGYYRIPDITSQTRISALRYALEQEEIVIINGQPKVDNLAASAIWLRGTIFQQIAKQVRKRLMHNVSQRVGTSLLFSSSDHPPILEATYEDIESVIRVIRSSITGVNGCDVQFLADEVKNDGQNDLFSMVGGNDEAKASLEDALCLDPSRRRLLSLFGIAPSTGILLYGPPGTGKTLLAKSVAKALRSFDSNSSSMGGAFITLNSSDIVRSEVGESEKLVVRAFQTARSNSPSFIFIDEFQALFTERTSSGSSSRLTTTLLQCMDDLNRWGDVYESIDKKRENNNTKLEDRVLVLAATNTPWMIDRAFLRPGRFDRSVHVNLPNHQERRSILQVQMRTMKMVDFDSHSEQLTTFIDTLASRTGGFSGADLAALCRAAAIQCLLDESDVVQEIHFLKVLDDGFKASSNRSLVERIQQWRP